MGERGEGEFTNVDDGWFSLYAAYQDKWPSDSLPVCTDLTSVGEPFETESNLSQPALCLFFSSICDLCTSLDTLSSHIVSRGSPEPTALNIQPGFRCVFEGHDPITHARRARCPAHVGSIFKECCHSHCHCPTCRSWRSSMMHRPTECVSDSLGSHLRTAQYFPFASRLHVFSRSESCDTSTIVRNVSSRHCLSILLMHMVRVCLHVCP